MSDLIKRSDAITVIEKNEYRLKGSGLTYQILLKQIDEIPSVDIPQSDDWEKYSDKLWKIAYERGKASVRPQGEWIVSDKDSVCSVCGKDEAEFICGTEDWYGYGLSNYCPNCGARMKGADDEMR